MKKITLLLSFLCAFLFSAPASAQTTPLIESVERATEIVEGKWYVMEQTYSGTSYLYENDSHALYRANDLAANDLKGLPFNDNKSVLVRFLKTDESASENTYYIQFATGYYIELAKNPRPVTTTKDSDSRGKIFVNKISNGTTCTFQFGTKTTTTADPLNKVIGVDDYDNSISLFTSPYGPDIDRDEEYGEFGSEWVLYEAKVSNEEMMKAVTVLMVNESNSSDIHTIELGEYPVGTTLSLHDYIPKTASGIVKYPNQEVIVSTNDSENTVTVKYTTLIPVAKNYQEMVDEGKWVALHTGNARTYVYDENTTDGYPVIDNATFMNLNPNYFWGFICKNPFTDPLYIVNQGAGSGKYLQLTGTTNKSACKMVSVSQDSELDNTERITWTLDAATANPNGAYDNVNNFYGIKCVGTSLYINNVDAVGKMLSLKQGPNINAATGTKFITEIETYRTLATRALTAPEGAVNSLKPECRKAITSKGDVNTITLDQFQEIVRIHNEGSGHGYIEMKPGAYYRILNWQNHNDAEKATVISFNDENRALAVNDVHNVDQLWQINKNADGTGYQLKSANKEQYLNRPSYPNLIETGTNYTFIDLGAGQHFISYEETGNLLVGTVDSNNDLTGMNANPAKSTNKKNSKDAWYLMPVNEFEIKLNNGGDGNYYATAHFPFDVMVENADAYVTSSVTKTNKLVMEKITDKIIPANTALVIIGKEETATVKIKGVTTETEGENETDSKTETWNGTNVLSGTNLDLIYGNNTENITKDDVLIFGKGKDSGKVGFFKPSSSDKVTMIRHNSAYLLRSELHTDSDQAVTYATFSFAGDETGIDNVEANTDDEAVTYDMQGRRVNNPSKGVYIVNGKKVLF